MASQLTKRGYKYRSLPTNDTDTFGDFLNDDSEFNIKKLDTDLEGLDEKVHLNGERQQNFNFIKNGVEKGFTAINSLDVTRISINTDLTIVYDFVLEKKAANDYNLIGRFGTNANYHGYIGFHVPTGHLEFGSGNQIYRKNVLSENRHYIMILTINKDSKEAKLYFEDFIGVRTFTQDTFEFLGVNAPTQKPQIKLLNSGYYNRILSIQEIQHTVSVLNNSPAIKELHTTDSTGKTSILRLGSDSAHVEMQTGRTLEEEYTSLLSRFGKEIDSPDGRAVQVDNGINGKVLNMSIKGQTVKNELIGIKAKPQNQDIVTINGNKVTFEKTSNGISYVLYDFIGVEPNTEYTICFNIEENNISEYGDDIQNYGFYPDGAFGVFNSAANTIPNLIDGITGIIKYKLRTTTNVSLASASFGFHKLPIGSKLTISNMTIIKGDWMNKDIEPIPFGLSSTEAIISNNGQQYPVYEPTIQGKTRILKAPKGTQNWVEISADETRDTSEFDYKLDSVGGNLGDVPSASDYIDRARKVKVINTKEIILTGNESWSEYGSTSPCKSFIITLSDAKPDHSPIMNVLPYKLTYDRSQESSRITDGNGNFVASILATKLATQDVNGFKTYLKDLNSAGKPATLRYQLATPQEVPLSEEELKAYDTYKKVISLPFAEDKLILNEDGSGTWINASYETNLRNLRWSINNTNGDFTVFKTSKPINAINGSTSICNYFGYSQTPATESFECIAVHQNGALYLNILSSKASTVEELNDYINNNDIVFVCKVTSNSTHLDKSIMPTIQTY